MFQRFLDDGPRRASYLVACPRAREAVVIDPRRDVDVYVDAARTMGVRIAWAFETHLRGDSVSGARELLALGARVIAGPGAGLCYPHHEAAGGERLRVGDLSILFIHTPGHTAEGLSVLASQPEQPVRLFTGDLIRSGGVGSPSGEDDRANERLAHALHDSLFGKVLVLDERIRVHPGDPGEAGTIGHQKRTNPMLRHRARQDFVAAVLAEVTVAPAYQSRLRRMNRDGPPLMGLAGGYRGPAAISPGSAAAALRARGIMIDLREPLTFDEGHARGAINLQPGPDLGSLAARLLPPDPRVVLLAPDGRQAAQAARQLLRVGVSRIDGYVNGGFAAWTAAGLPVSGGASAVPSASSVLSV